MEEIKDLIKQEDYEKYKKLLQEFECKAIDIIEDLTYQFKETLAEEIDDKIKGWKKDNERILRENWEKDDKIKQLEQELAELKEKAIGPKFKFDEECVVIMFGSYHFHRFIAQVKDDLCLTQPYNDTEEWYYVKPEMVCKTLEEAQDKLKEMQGNE